MVITNIFNSPQQATQLIPAWTVVKKVNFIEHHGAESDKKAWGTRQQRISRLGCSDQHKGRIGGRNGAGITTFHAQGDLEQC